MCPRSTDAKYIIFNHLRTLRHALWNSVIHVLFVCPDIPEDAINTEEVDEDSKNNPDERVSIRASDKRVANDNEFSDSEDEGEGGRKDQR